MRCNLLRLHNLHSVVYVVVHSILLQLSRLQLTVLLATEISA